MSAILSRPELMILYGIIHDKSAFDISRAPNRRKALDYICNNYM